MAFRFGRAWGFQSHVEVDGDALERMLASIDVDPAEAEPIVAALRAAEESADPPKARVEALLDAFATDALG
jgi:predicted TPR repeat methyltransferase